MEFDLKSQYLMDLPVGGVRFFETIGSTNDEALTWAEDGAPDFSLVAANQQTAGRGRLGRHWVTLPGAALAASLIVRPRESELESLANFSPWGGCAICQALEELGLQPQIKWPNDVLLGRKKIAGILLESVWQGGQPQAVVIGMGINIAPGGVPPAGEVQFPAGCVEDALGRPLDRWELLASLLRAMLAWRPHLDSAGFRQGWEKRLAFQGEWVRVGSGLEATRLGKIVGLGEQGSLRLVDANGEPFSLQVGEVSLRLAEDER